MKDAACDCDCFAYYLTGLTKGFGSQICLQTPLCSKTWIQEHKYPFTRCPLLACVLGNYPCSAGESLFLWGQLGMRCWLPRDTACCASGLSLEGGGQSCLFFGHALTSRQGLNAKGRWMGEKLQFWENLKHKNMFGQLGSEVTITKSSQIQDMGIQLARPLLLSRELSVSLANLCRRTEWSNWKTYWLKMHFECIKYHESMKFCAKWNQNWWILWHWFLFIFFPLS